MCMCGEWMMYGDDGDNNGESLILLLLSLRGYIPFLHFEAFLRRIRCSIFYFSFLSGGYLVPLVLLSNTCPFLPLVLLFLFFWGFGHLPLFISSYLSLFFRALVSWNDIASGINQDNSSIYFTGKNRNRRMLLAILSRIRSRILLGGSGDGNEWIYVDAYFRSRSSMCEWTCKWILILTAWQAPKGLHSLTTLNAHKQ